MKRWIIIAVASLSLVGCVDRAAQEQGRITAKIVGDPTQVIQVMSVTTQPLSDTLEITGDVTTGQDAEIGARLSGKLMAVYVKEGDPVVGEQVIASQDTSTQQAQLRQALAGLSSASSQLRQAVSNAAVGPAKSAAAVRSAEAQMRSAQANLKKVRAGARPEERIQVEWQVKQAKTNLDTAQKELDRTTTLVEQGALPRQRLDQAQNAYMQALTGYNAALQNQAMQLTGARPEDISVAEEAVRSAQEALRQARSQKQLDVLLKDQVRAAQAGVASARAQVDVARQSLEDAQIRAPFTGRIQGKPAQPGQIVGPGSVIARVVATGSAYFEGNIPESEISRIQQGMPVSILISAFPGKMYSGHVAAISPVGSDVGRQFVARVTFDSSPGEVKPGMFARGVITLRTVPNAILVPATAVVPYKDQQVVFVLNGKDAVKPLPVTTGLRKGDQIQITSGLSAGEKVVVRGQEGSKEDSKVRVEEQKTAANEPNSGAPKG